MREKAVVTICPSASVFCLASHFSPFCILRASRGGELIIQSFTTFWAKSEMWAYLMSVSRHSPGYLWGRTRPQVWAPCSPFLQGLRSIGRGL